MPPHIRLGVRSKEPRARLRHASARRQDAPVDIPETRYAKTADGVHIAYQVAGEGAVDLVVVASVLGLGEIWRGRRSGQFLRRLASFSRLILLDWRGTGLSDHVIDRMQQLSLENRMEDVRAVRNAIGSSRAVLLSAGEEQRACPPVSLIRSEWAVPRDRVSSRSCR